MSRATPRLVAFLRAINVGGHVVTMDRLRSVFVAQGLKDAETFIASGNVVFSGRPGAAAGLARRIEKALAAALGYEVATFIRTDAEVAAIAGYEAFPAKLITRAKSHCVGFVAEPLTAGQRRALLALRTEDDDFHVAGREVWWLSRVGQGRSKFNNTVFERLGTRATWRGINTVRRLADKYGFAAAT